MEKIETPSHRHPLIPFTRFTSTWCKGCNGPFNDIFGSALEDIFCNVTNIYIYGGYRCNEPDCTDDYVLHKECAKPLEKIKHSSHPNHLLKLIILDSEESICNLCLRVIKVGYCCSVCDFKLDLACARRPEPLVLPENSYRHEHPLHLFLDPTSSRELSKICKVCDGYVALDLSHYRCFRCEIFVHVDCVDLFPEAYHNSHPRHPLMSLKREVPDYADKKCLLCEKEFDGQHHQLHHCDVCNFSICRACMKNPPPINVECLTTHEHQLHLVPRRIDFTCNACGTKGDRSPYFCLPCNFMIHRECIDLPRVININRHDHRISYTRRLGHGEWKCRVCRENVDEFYGAYICTGTKCRTLVVHSRCAIDKEVWDMVELEGTPKEEDIPQYEVIDDNTIKHFSHKHNLRINKDDGEILHEDVLCKACVFQICSEPFYRCEQCDFILHQKCAYLPRKKRHMCDNHQFTLHTDFLDKANYCWFCSREFTGFAYVGNHNVNLDVRCGSTSDSLQHESHPHPLYYCRTRISPEECNQCGDMCVFFFRCAECNYFLDGKCALLPKKVIRKRYDDHPLFLSFNDEKQVDGECWCEACETKLDLKKCFYTCNDCGISLHTSCLVGDFSSVMPGSTRECYPDGKIVSNTSITRKLCYGCNSRCIVSSILKLSTTGDDVYVCSQKCREQISL